MTSVLQNSIRDLLREIGPSTPDEILHRLAAAPPLVASKNPAQTVRNALTNDPACQTGMGGRYLYLPAFIRGASMRLSMDLAAPERRLLATDAEASGLLWPAERSGPGTGTRTLALEAGPEVPVRARGTSGMLVLLEMPADFWRWWERRRQAGHDALALQCQDGETARFGATSLRTTDLDRQTVAARNHQLREAAEGVLGRTRYGLDPSDLARRVLARGIYHGEPSPETLKAALLESGHPFFLERGQVTHRPEITPSLRRVFAPRLEAQSSFFEEMLAESTGLPTVPRVGREPAPAPVAERDSGLGCRIKVSLQWNRRVWRVIEILAGQTLEDLHLAIQEAFDWDNDHLYAFFMSGRAWDGPTEIKGPFGEAEPPTADEVTLAELGLIPGQKFLYIFDFGDDLRHQVEVLETFSPPPDGEYPRISESHGKAPQQYSD